MSPICALGIDPQAGIAVYFYGTLVEIGGHLVAAEVTERRAARNIAGSGELTRLEVDRRIARVEAISVGGAELDRTIDRDLFAQPARNYIHQTQVLLTFVEGQLVYDRHGALGDIGLKAVWQGEPPVLEGKAE